MIEIITIGETMATMTPKGTGYLHYIKDYEMRIAGAESNLAIGVCKLGHSASWISSLGNDELGFFVNNNIRAEGVDTSYTKFDPQHRTGVMFKQILPNVMTPIIVSTTTNVAYFILQEASLSFIGLGVADSTPTWGNILNAAKSIQVVQNQWWIWVFPGAAISLFVLAINFFGDGLRDVLDAKQQ